MVIKDTRRKSYVKMGMNSIPDRITNRPLPLVLGPRDAKETFQAVKVSPLTSKVSLRFAESNAMAGTPAQSVQGEKNGMFWSNEKTQTYTYSLVPDNLIIFVRR